MRPVIIIGAPRSGTNMLRDLLCRLPGVGTWPCDEINPIWRHGNRAFPTDQLTPRHATEPVRRFVRRHFERIANRLDLTVTVEKTCANCLRVGFVDRILPEALFILLLRDGRDASASAIKRWKAPLDLRYALRKARYVPVADLPYYSWRYMKNRGRRLFSKDGRIGLWGPVFEGLAEIVENEGLAAACAAQWAACVEASSRDLAAVDPKRVCSVRYEELVRTPAEHLSRLAAFIGVGASDSRIREAAGSVTAAHVGKWRRDLTADQLATVIRRAGAALERHDYVR